MDRPWLVEEALPEYEDLLWGYVMVHADRRGFYWTGMGLEGRWSANPRRALVDVISPWDQFKSPVQDGRCVNVLLEDEVTMLPLHLWPRSDQPP